MDDYFDPLSFNGTGIIIGDQGLPQSNAVVEQNRIELYRRNTGISVSAGNGYIIRDNDIEVMSGFYPEVEGIQIAGSEKVIVSCNDVIGLGTGTGIEVYNNTKLKVNCNFTRNLHTGMRTDGLLPNTFIATNIFRAPLNVGLQYRPGVDMIPIQPHLGNIWPDPASAYTNAAAQHLGSGPALYFNNQRFEIHNPSSAYYPPSISIPNAAVPITTWFTPANGSPLLCTPQDCPLIGLANDFGEIGTREEALAQGSYGSAWPAGKQWLARWQLYDWLKEEPSAMSNSTPMINFYNAQETNQTGQFYQFQEDADDYFQSAPQILQSWMNERAQREVLLDGLMQADSMAAADPTSGGSAQVKNLVSQIDSVNALMAIELANMKLSQLPLYNSLDSLNASITGTAPPITSLRRVNDLYLKALHRDSLYLSANELADLYNIALQCPDQIGPAVYRARTLYALFDQVNFDSLGCPQSFAAPQMLEIPVSAKPANFSVYPNPAKGSFTLEYHQLATEAQVRLLDIWGQVVHTQPLEEGEGRQHINLMYNQPGVYLLFVLDSKGNLLLTRKLVLVD